MIYAILYLLGIQTVWKILIDLIQLKRQQTIQEIENKIKMNEEVLRLNLHTLKENEKYWCEKYKNLISDLKTVAKNK